MKIAARPLAALACALALVTLAPAQQPPQSSPQQPAQPAAASPTYRVELLVLRPVNAYGSAENWGASAQARGLGGGAEAADVPSGSTVGRFTRLLGPAELQLREVAQKLRESGQYELVAHVGWMQTASAWGTRAGFALPRLGVRVPGLSGSVFLERGQFLHLGMALRWEMSDPPAGIGAGPGTTFALDESRRVRFYERNYYDHPAFGVIALVTPAQGSRPAGR